jgi:tight adherence protein B
MEIIDYEKYTLSPKERLDYYLVACTGLFLLGMLFYRSLWASVCLSGLAKLLEGKYIDHRIKKRRKGLLDGFRDLLYALSSSLASGHQMPKAVAEAKEEIKAVYGEDADIYRELLYMSRSYESARMDMEELWTDFGERSGLWEIQQFASAYRVCRRSGGSMEDVALKSADLLLDKLSFQSELDALMAQSRLDILLLCLIPLVILVFLNMFSYSYISLMYESLAGRLIMTLALGIAGGAALWSAKILDIGF